MWDKGDPKLLCRHVASCTRYSCADYLDEPPYLTKYEWSGFSGMKDASGHQFEDSAALQTDFFLLFQYFETQYFRGQ